MKLTVHADTFDRAEPCAFAVLEVDPGQSSWSLLTAMGLDLPESGTLDAQGDSFYVCGTHGAPIYCILECLPRASDSGGDGCRTGVAQWCGSANLPSGVGHWHISAEECDATLPSDEDAESRTG